MGQAARSTAFVCTVASALQTAASAGAHPATRDLTVLTYVHRTLMGSTALPAAPAKMPLPAPPSTARAFARKVGSVVTALCPVLLAPGASVVIPVVSVPTRESAVPKQELVLVLLGGTELTASFLARKGSLVTAVPVSVTVTTLMAATLFMDTADVRLAGWAHAATCLAQRAFGEPTAAILAPAKMGVLVYPRMATVCVHQGSEAPPARGVRLPVPHPTPWLLSLTSISRAVNQGKVGGETLVKAPKSPGIPFPSLPAWSLWQTLCALQV